MSELSAPLVLASASPRRSAILRTLGIDFVAVTSQVDESSRTGEPPADFAVRVAADKAADVARRLEGREVVLGADTVVVIDDECLGKPSDDDEARRMIASLSGRWHEVLTAIALARAGGGALGHDLVTTRVRFRGLTESEIHAYVASGEGRDKAGAYAVQGLGAGLVSEIAGCYHNVVGLPTTRTLQLLRRHGVLLGWP